jgi:DNA repair protein RadC
MPGIKRFGSYPRLLFLHWLFVLFRLLDSTAFIRATPLSFRAPSAGACAIIHFQTIKKIEIMAANKHLIEEVNRYTVSDLKISYYPKMRNCDRAMVNRSGDAYPLFLDKWDMGNIYLVESAYLMLLNRGNRVLGIMPISMGGITGTVVDPRVIFRYALVAGAAGIMLAHNHPSGNLKPSKADELVTQKIKQAAWCHDIQFLDHLILTPEGYLSMADEGLL